MFQPLFVIIRDIHTEKPKRNVTPVTVLLHLWPEPFCPSIQLSTLLLKNIFCDISYVTFHDTTLKVAPFEGLRQMSLMSSWINTSLTSFISSVHFTTFGTARIEQWSQEKEEATKFAVVLILPETQA
jgi:hypothetical protein